MVLDKLVARAIICNIGVDNIGEATRSINRTLIKFFGTFPRSLEVNESRLLTFHPFPDEPDISEFNSWYASNISPIYFADTRRLGYTAEDGKSVLSSKFSNFSFILLPGLAFTLDGDRLGRGFGWYDKVLAKVDETCLRIAVTWNLRIVTALPIEKFDQKVDVLVTEGRIVICRDKNIGYEVFMDK